MSQVTIGPSGLPHREFFGGATDAEVERKMDAALAKLRAEGHSLKQRVKIGRNDVCPCGSGIKFKKCCISKMQ